MSSDNIGGVLFLIIGCYLGYVLYKNVLTKSYNESLDQNRPDAYNSSAAAAAASSQGGGGGGGAPAPSSSDVWASVPQPANASGMPEPIVRGSMGSPIQGGGDATQVGGGGFNPGDLLPKDTNSEWAQLNPAGKGDLANVDLLQPGVHFNIDTVGQSSRKNGNLQDRPEPPNPQMNVGIWNQSTITPDFMRPVVNEQ